MRHTYSPLAIAHRHPRLFSKLTSGFRLHYMPTAKDGTHIVAVHSTERGVFKQVGVLWGQA